MFHKVMAESWTLTPACGVRLGVGPDVRAPVYHRVLHLSSNSSNGITYCCACRQRRPPVQKAAVALSSTF